MSTSSQNSFWRFLPFPRGATGVGLGPSAERRGFADSREVGLRVIFHAVAGGMWHRWAAAVVPWQWFDTMFSTETRSFSQFRRLLSARLDWVTGPGLQR